MIATFLRYRRFVAQYWLRLGAGALLTLASSLLALAQPWPLKVIVDSVLRGKRAHVPGFDFPAGWSRTQLLWVVILAYLVIVGLGALFDYFGTWLMDSSGVRIVADIREALFARLQRLSLRFHAHQRTGDLITRMMTDISRLQDMLIQSFSILLPNVALIVGMLAVMFWIDWTFSLIALAVAPPVFFLAVRYKLRIKGASRRARSLEGTLAARAGQVLGAVQVVQAFTREDFEDERFSEQSSRTLTANLEAARLQAQFSPLIDVLAGLGTAVVLYVGTRRVLSGQLSLGILLVFLSYLNALYRPMRQLSKLAYVSSRGIASAERVAEVLQAESDVREFPRAERAPRFEGLVEFEGVDFGYGSELVLRDVNLRAEPGELVAVVGPTGAGKSTLASLVPRFFDPQRGRVLIDTRDVRRLQLYSLRSQIALVLQEPILFEGTILDNIAYGRRETTVEQVRAAAEAALVAEFVGRLPKGYDTVVGERGATLSGGERQRISIARALVRDAPILILDEPTSALDPASEQLLLEALRNLMQGRTTFVIAHRMSTVAGADQVIVLDDGRIVETGSHAELLRVDGGRYRSFLELQLRATSPDRAGAVIETDVLERLSPELVLISPAEFAASARRLLPFPTVATKANSKRRTNE